MVDGQAAWVVELCGVADTFGIAPCTSGDCARLARERNSQNTAIYAVRNDDGAVSADGHAERGCHGVCGNGRHAWD